MPGDYLFLDRVSAQYTVGDGRTSQAAVPSWLFVVAAIVVCVDFFLTGAALDQVLSPSSQRKTAQRGSGMAGFVDATAARTLAPPEIAPLSSEEEFEFGEEEEDMERAVDVLLLEIEVRQNGFRAPFLVR